MAKKHEVAETKLTAADRKELAKHEETIKKGLASFVEVGRSLAAIRDGRLYRENYKTFQDYCQDNLGINKSYAYCMIESAEVVQEIETSTNSGHIPATETHARELAKAGDDAPKVWKEVVKRSPKLADGTPCTTAKQIAAIRDELLKPKQENTSTSSSDVLAKETSKSSTNGVAGHSASETKEEIADNPFRSEAERMAAASVRLSQIAGDVHRVAEEVSKFTGDGFKTLVNKDNIDIALANIVDNLKVHAHTLRTSAPACICLDCEGRGCIFCGHRRYQTVGERKDAESRRTAKTGSRKASGAVA